MRQLASFLLFGFALTASAAEIWRWKDADGTWHYSDTRTPGAERMIVNPPAKSGSPAPRPAPTYSSAPMVLPQEIGRYARCIITLPVEDTVFQWTETIAASFVVEPGLQPEHHTQVLLNGAPYPQWPADTFAYNFSGLSRGSYSLSVRVTGPQGAVLCSGPTITFHVRQPSVLAPARKPAGK